jgi:hypothetical protein
MERSATFSRSEGLLPSRSGSRGRAEGASPPARRRVLPYIGWVGWTARRLACGQCLLLVVQFGYRPYASSRHSQHRYVSPVLRRSNTIGTA